MRNIIISTFVLLFVLTGCGTRQGQYRIGLSQCLDDAWRQKMNDEMERELLLHPEMAISRRIAYGSSELQCAQIDSFIAERVDLLIVSPNVGEEVKPAVTRAYRAGIPVVIADRRVSGEEWTAFIGGDNYRVGQLMADWVLSIQSTEKQALHVLEVAGLPGSTPATLRHQGMMDRITQSSGIRPEIESVMGSWYKEDAYLVVLEYLRTHKHVELIVAHNDLMAIGAAEAVRDSKGYRKGSVRIMGVDGITLGMEAILDGTIECSATYPSRGDIIIETAAHILANEPYVRDTVLETMLVDATIAQPMLIQYHARMHDFETLKIVQLQSEQRWQQIRYGRIVLVVIIVGVSLLFLFILAFLLYSQRNIKKEIKRDILPQLEEVQEAIQLSYKDVAFSERMKQIVDDHLTDPNLNVEFLGSTLALSRTQIFRRVKTIIGKGPLDYIREQRLKRADELLRTTDMTIQQVALELCFSSPGYFTKCYKDYFGHLPSER
jgi:ABC-type sugar transport system substrate-binding protein/AraC-like DNA-binding protein